MSITRADVADLRAGDVVELADEDWCGAVMRGPLIEDYDGALILGVRSRLMPTRFTVRHPDGRPGWQNCRTLTVISRAKPPLYVNSDKTEPDPGDVVRDADDASSTENWRCCDKSSYPWVASVEDGYDWLERRELPARLRLLVDGRTGQVVPS